MSLYPLPMRFPTTLGNLDVVIEVAPKGNWEFRSDEDRMAFGLLPVSERLDLRRALAAQVDLAESTYEGRTI